MTVEVTTDSVADASASNERKGSGSYTGVHLSMRRIKHYMATAPTPAARKAIKSLLGIGGKRVAPKQKAGSATKSAKKGK